MDGIGNLPAARVVTSRPSPDHPSMGYVEVDCPFCGDQHEHGVTDHNPPDGMHPMSIRAAVCNGEQYRIVFDDPPNLSPPAEEG